MYHSLPYEKVVNNLKSNAKKGLATKEAKKRLEKYGPNILPQKKEPPVILKFVAQFKNLLVLILLFATVVSFALGEILDAVAIFTIVLINALIGFVQEVNAEKTLKSLREKEELFALVLRDEEIVKIPHREIVPGDILILQEGAKIPADARIIEAFSLRIEESTLTGESASVGKTAKTLDKSTPLADRINMVYKDTEVLAGRGKAVVVATGKDTEVGKIAAFLGKSHAIKTPLTIELESVAKILTILIGIIAGIIFIFNTLSHMPFVESLLVSISLAVAAIPEGLPAIVTIVLSIGVKRLADKKSIVKKLPAVETLGSVKIIATDKTGTLTQNKISAVGLHLANGRKLIIKGEGYKPNGLFFDSKNKAVDPSTDPSLQLLLKAAVLASDATLQNNGQDKNDDLKIIGDTTEAALLVAAIRAGINLSNLKNSQEKIYEIPFIAERKMMSVAVKVNDTGDHFLYVKGAPEVVVERCRLSADEKKKILYATQKMASKGLRNLAVAKKRITKEEVKKMLEENKIKEEDLSFLGVIGMQDPLRPEVKEAIRNAQIAGIRTIMITGDHKNTALAIAKQAGLTENNTQAYTEDDLNKMTDEELTEVIKKGVNVFARISPMGKLRIIESIKKIPHMQVAVTGDGVNDAPALKAGHIGIAMGKTGTDLTCEVADLVITDDNYATIVTAVREGRVIFANLVKFIRYLISCNLSEVIVVSVAVFSGSPLPLLPIQILWINLITDGLPALALGVDPPEPNVMKKPPRDLSISILHKKRWFYMIIEGGLMGALVYYLFLYALNYYSVAVAQTMAFSALAFTQLVHAFNNRSTRQSLFTLGILTNKLLVVTVIVSTLLQIAIVQTLFGNIFLKTIPLRQRQWLVIGFVSFAILAIVETKKQLRTRFQILP